MRIAVGADERTAATDALVEELRQRGHEIIMEAGAIGGSKDPWSEVGKSMGASVANGQADMGVVCCWTGTGVSIAANKVPGVRAALCVDAATASGARRWNDANVLALSLRLATPAIVSEILDSWFAAEVDTTERTAIDSLEIPHA